MLVHQYKTILYRLLPNPPIAGNITVLVTILMVLVSVSLVLTLLGLGTFYSIWVQQRRKFSAIPPQPIPSNALPSQPMLSNALPSQETVTSPFKHEYLLLPFQRVLEKQIPPVTSRKKPRSLAHIQRKVSGAMKKWQKRGQPEHLIELALEILARGRDEWNTYIQALQALYVRLSPNQVREYEQQALEAIHNILKTKESAIIENHCSFALILYTMILPFIENSSEPQAAIYFDMGFAFASLSMNPEQCILAQQYYTYAGHFFERNNIIPKYYRPYIHTHLSLGDVLVLLSNLQMLEENVIKTLQEALRSYEKALAYYTQIQHTSKDDIHLLSKEINERISQTKERLARIGA